MASALQLGDITVDVLLKDIKNVHLSVHPPTGRVRIAAPIGADMDAIRVFAISKIDWIRKHQAKLVQQDREPPREYIDRESHYVWGERLLLDVVERDQAPAVERDHRRLVLYVRPGVDRLAKEAVLSRWYRELVKAEVPALIAAWEPVMGVKVQRFYVQQMKTKWGSCTPMRRSIRLNTELALKPKMMLEYVVVHEMVHLLEPTHNQRFVAYMDRFMPNWPHLQRQLNSLPVRHSDWEL
ncbi:MAG: SprT family zinc-dependent metalloprotease [Planctomycetota bacterium]